MEYTTPPPNADSFDPSPWSLQTYTAQQDGYFLIDGKKVFMLKGHQFKFKTQDPYALSKVFYVDPVQDGGFVQTQSGDEALAERVKALLKENERLEKVIRELEKSHNHNGHLIESQQKIIQSERDRSRRLYEKMQAACLAHDLIRSALKLIPKENQGTSILSQSTPQE